MHSRYAELVTALSALQNAIKRATPESRSVMEIAGNNWSVPAIDKADLALVVSQVSAVIVERAPEDFDDQDEVFIAGSLSRLQLLETVTLPNVFTANGANAIPSLILSLQAIENWARHTWPAQEVLEPGSLPHQLARKARNAKAKLDEITASLGDMESKVGLILEAHQTADALPADLQELREARDAIQKFRDSARDNVSDTKMHLTDAAIASEAASSAAKEAEGYAKKSSAAYGFTTSHGLAAAFDARSKAIAKSTWVWVAFLLAALAGAALLGHFRVTALTTLLGNSEPKWGVVALNLILSIASVGAPLWFAWIATKQIGQRFRLAEDYGFKASVAKAYEGYKNEAVALDPAFASALFGVALDRLKEAPIRLVEESTPGSPWHELMKDANIAEAVRSAPNAASRISQFAADIVGQLKGTKPAGTVLPQPSKAED